MIKRGLIRAGDGAALARSLPRAGQDLHAHVSHRRAVRARGRLLVHEPRARGLERYYNDALTGRSTELVSALDSVLGSDREGDDLRTSLNPKAQEVAYQGLAARKGAAWRSTSRPARSR